MSPESAGRRKQLEWRRQQLLGIFAPRQSERTEQETDEEAAGVSEKDGRWIEVVAQEAKNRAGQRNSHDRDEGVSVQQRDHEHHECGEQGGTGRQASSPSIRLKRW